MNEHAPFGMNEDSGGSEEIKALCRAHLALQGRVDRLTQRIAANETHQKFILSVEEEISTRTVQNLLLFAQKNAVDALKRGHIELSRSYNVLCESNSLQQVELRTAASDCTLADFRTLSRFFLSNRSYECDAFPSELYVQHSEPGTSTRLHVVFGSYFDICEALQISAKIREQGVYRSKTDSSGQMGSVQIMGVDMLASEDCANRARFILLGRGVPTSLNQRIVPTLHQSNTSWSENSWEGELMYKEESVANIVRSTNSGTPVRFVSNLASSDINAILVDRNLFRISWERSIQATGPNTSADCVPGSLRSFFPAVILRTRILTSSVQRVFSTRVRAVYLKQILSSANHST